MATNKFLMIVLTSIYLCFDVKCNNEDRLNNSLSNYDYFECVLNDMIKVHKDGRCGFVNIRGREIISPCNEYTDMGLRSNYYSDFCPLLVKDTITLFSKKGKMIKSDIIESCDYSGIIYFKNKIGIVVKEKIKYLDSNMYEFFPSEKYFLFRCNDGNREYSLLYDHKGNKILKYDYINYMIDCTDNKVFPILSKKYFIVKNNNKYGVVDNKDHLIVPYNFDQNDFCLAGNYIVCNNYNAGQCYFKISSFNGKNFSSLGYDKYSTYKEYIFAWYGLRCDILCDGKSVNDFVFGKNIMKKNSSGLSLNTLVKKCPLEYFYIYENLLVYKINGSYGVINKQGKEILPCKYSSIDISNNLIIAYKTFDLVKSIVSIFNKNGKCLKDDLVYSPSKGRVEKGYVFTNTEESIIFIWNDKTLKSFKIKAYVSK